TFWENDAIYHHARLSESVSVFAQNTTDYQGALAQLGIVGQTANAQLNQLVTQQGFMMATNDFFHLSAGVFIALAALVWITKPRKGAGPA
ncbi:hypothetical protein SB761_30245, partial [Pseudomonas sp. SIMBA_064]